MITLSELLISAQTLPPSDRALLIASLWETISPLDWVLPSQSWIEEANRRSDTFDAGGQDASSWQDSRTRARKAAGLDS